MSYVYIFSNKSMPGLVKIGKTTMAPSQRMRELHSTGVPTPFETELTIEVTNCDTSERAAHLALDAHRVAANREFFQISPRDAIKAILPVVGEYKLVDVRDPQGIAELDSQLKRRAEELRKYREALIAAESERARIKAQRLAELRRRLTVAKDKLTALGPRPDTAGNPWLITLCLVGALLATVVFPPVLLIFGYMARKKPNEGVSKVLEPFLPVEAEIRQLELAIQEQGKFNP